MIINIEPDYLTISKLEEKWGCTASDIFNWGAECLLRIWNIDKLRKDPETPPISSKEADQIYLNIGLLTDDDIGGPDITDNASIDLANYLSHEDKLRAHELEDTVLYDYAVKNEEIQRVEQEFISREYEEFADKREIIDTSKIKFDLGYRTIVELEDEWENTISDIFEWTVNGKIKIWHISNLRLNPEAKQITHEKADEIFHMLTLEGMELADSLDCGFDSGDYGRRTGREYAITNKEIKRFEEKHKEPESENEHETRLAKRREEKKEQKREIAETLASIMAEPLQESKEHPNPTKTNNPEKKLKETKKPQNEKNDKVQPKTHTLEIPAKHHYYPRHIAIMIHCWNVIYREMPKGIRLNKNHAEIIRNWLKINYPDRGYLSGKNLEHIAIAVNPRPKGLSPAGSISWEPTENQEDPNTKTRLGLYEGHPYSVIEPPIAIHCWNDLYLNRDPDAPKPEDGHKKMIKKWLIKNYGDKPISLGEDRLVQIINPRFKGWDATPD